MHGRLIDQLFVEPVNGVRDSAGDVLELFHLELLFIQNGVVLKCA